MSDLINCGVYIFTPEIFAAIEDVFKQRKERGRCFFLYLVFAIVGTTTRIMFSISMVLRMPECAVENHSYYSFQTYIIFLFNFNVV